MKISKKDSGKDYFETMSSPCCGEKLEHKISSFNNKPYQAWVCVKCGTGWNNTTTDTWNMKQQKLTPPKK